MKNRREKHYSAGGVRAKVVHLWGDSSKHYIRLELWCKQAQELVTSEVAVGTKDELRDRYYSWQQKAYDHTRQFGKVHIAKLDA